MAGLGVARQRRLGAARRGAAGQGNAGMARRGAAGRGNAGNHSGFGSVLPSPVRLH